MPNAKRNQIKDILTEGKDAASEDKPPKRPEFEEALVPTSLRLPQSMISRLNRAAFEQKEARKRPQTRQGIITEALGEWLDRHEKIKK